jgi:hypothetical protein
MQIKTEEEVISGIYDKNYSVIIWFTLWKTFYIVFRRRRYRDRMVVWFTNTGAINAYHHLSCEFEPISWWGVCSMQRYMIMFVSDLQ